MKVPPVLAALHGQKRKNGTQLKGVLGCPIQTDPEWDSEDCLK